MADKKPAPASTTAKPAAAKPAGGKRKTPSAFSKKKEMLAKASAAVKENRVKALEQAKKNKELYLARGKLHREEFEKAQQHLIDAAREAKKAGNFFVPEQAKLFLVVRIKGLNKIPPQEKKILRLFRLRQLNNATFVRCNKATQNMLRRVEPWITYGAPTHATIRNLVYKRGYGTINGQRIPLNDNRLIALELGKFNINCVEDLIHELWTVGPHFKEANAFLWPFKLDSPRGGLHSKRHQFINGGDQGPREEFINNLADAML